MARKARLGSGGRFRALTRKGMSRALAAYIGRRKYGKARFQRLASAGRRRASRSRGRSRR